MKKILYFLGLFLLLGCAESVDAQGPTTSTDFTLNDCNGTEHQLFSELDKGDVVAIEFVMGCLPCVQGRKALDKMEASYAVSHPGKFHAYTFGYSKGTDCTNIQSWMSTNKFSGACFGGVDSVISAYGAEVGMPTMCIVGGVDHKVLYWKAGFGNKDTTAMKTAISQVLQTSSVSPTNNSNESLAIYPNPSSLSASLKISCLKEGVRNVTLFSAKGTKVLSIFDGRLSVGEESTIIPLTVVH